MNMQKLSNFILAAVLIIGGVGTASADSVANKVGLSGIAAAAFPLGDDSVMDNTNDVGHDFGGMLRVGLNPNLSAGFSYDNISLYGENGERHRPETMMANVLFHLAPDKRLVPTVQTGVGIASTLKGDTFDNFTARAGLGLDYFFTPNFSAGPQLTYTYIENGRSGIDEYHALGVGLMASVYFDVTQEPAAATPAAVAAVAAPVMTDSDGDGVPNSADNCPNTPSSIAVDAYGCPKPLEQKVSLELFVLFDTGKTKVRPEYRGEVKKVADFLGVYPNAKAEIEGYTDNIGPDEDNQRLSQERADHIRQFLIKEFNLDPARITAVGYGETRPVADNATPEGQAKNRRVMVTFEATKMVTPTNP